MNIRQKGANGEREVATDLNAMLYRAMADSNLFSNSELQVAFSAIQRNQNQSAVGGKDLSNTFGLSIEVKRQESLSVNTWWQQCLKAAIRNDEQPVLVYRQNRKPWRVRMFGWLPINGGHTVGHTVAVVEIDYDSFLGWFYAHVLQCLLKGYKIQI